MSYVVSLSVPQRVYQRGRRGPFTVSVTLVDASALSAGAASVSPSPLAGAPVDGVVVELHARVLHTGGGTNDAIPVPTKKSSKNVFKLHGAQKSVLHTKLPWYPEYEPRVFTGSLMRGTVSWMFDLLSTHHAHDVQFVARIPSLALSSEPAGLRVLTTSRPTGTTSASETASAEGDDVVDGNDNDYDDDLLIGSGSVGNAGGESAPPSRLTTDMVGGGGGGGGGVFRSPSTSDGSVPPGSASDVQVVPPAGKRGAPAYTSGASAAMPSAAAAAAAASSFGAHYGGGADLSVQVPPVDQQLLPGAASPTSPTTPTMRLVLQQLEQIAQHGNDVDAVQARHALFELRRMSHNLGPVSLFASTSSQELPGVSGVALTQQQVQSQLQHQLNLQQPQQPQQRASSSSLQLQPTQLKHMSSTSLDGNNAGDLLVAPPLYGAQYGMYDEDPFVMQQQQPYQSLSARGDKRLRDSQSSAGGPKRLEMPFIVRMETVDDEDYMVMGARPDSVNSRVGSLLVQAATLGGGNLRALAILAGTEGSTEFDALPVAPGSSRALAAPPPTTKSRSSSGQASDTEALGKQLDRLSIAGADIHEQPAVATMTTTHTTTTTTITTTTTTTTIAKKSDAGASGGASAGAGADAAAAKQQQPRGTCACVLL